MGNEKKIFSLTLIFITFLFLSFLVYRPAFSSYFFQDDWFTFQISKARNLQEFIDFFSPRLDVIYYRPLGMQIYFFIMRALFGFNFVYYRIITLLVYSLSGLFVFLILKQLKIAKIISLFGGLFYVSSTATYIPFHWSATFPFVLGPFFFLLSFFSYITSSVKRKKIISFFFYLLGLLTLEILVILPFILILWEILFNKRKSLKTVFLFLLPIIPYVILRVFLFPVPLIDTYSPEIKILSTLRNYLFWTFNWPEEMYQVMVAPFTINPDFIKNFPDFVLKWVLNSVLIISILIVLPLSFKLINFIKFKKELISKEDVFSICFYFFGLAPLFPFANHTYPYYLPVAFFGFTLFLSYQLHYLTKKLNLNLVKQLLLIIFILSIWIYSSFTTINFNKLIHWAPQRARLSFEAITKASSYTLDNGSVIKANKKYELPLAGQNAFRTVFNKKIITIYTNNVSTVSDK